MMLVKLDSTGRRVKLDLCSLPCKKNLKCTNDIKIKPKTLKPLVEEVGKTLQGKKHRQGLFA